jgi:hypothetical protein
LSSDLAYLVLSFAAIGAHAVATIQILQNFADMVTTFFKKDTQSDEIRTKPKGNAVSMSSTGATSGRVIGDKTIIKSDNPKTIINDKKNASAATLNKDNQDESQTKTLFGGI